MNRKIDYHDDPAAPEPNSLVPAVSVVVGRDDGAILLIRRTDNENWALPGGAIELNESVRQAAIRETREETGIVGGQVPLVPMRVPRPSRTRCRPKV